jgi:hypothetical protein
MGLDGEIKNQMKTIDDIVSMVSDTSQFSASIGKSGGRTFTVKTDHGEKTCKFKELAEYVVKQVNDHPDEATKDKIDSIIKGLQEIDKRKKDLDKLGITDYQKFMTKIKRAFGNIAFSRKTTYGTLAGLSQGPATPSKQEAGTTKPSTQQTTEPPQTETTKFYDRELRLLPDVKETPTTKAKADETSSKKAKDAVPASPSETKAKPSKPASAPSTASSEPPQTATTQDVQPSKKAKGVKKAGKTKADAKTETTAAQPAPQPTTKPSSVATESPPPITATKIQTSPSSKKAFGIKLTSPCIFTSGMNEVEIKDRAKTLISSLKGGVMKWADFEKNYESTGNAGWYRIKNNPSEIYIQKAGENIQRLVGKRWIDHVAQENKCDKVKTPEIRLFAEDGIQLQVTKDGCIDFKLDVLGTAPKRTYLERGVEIKDRKISIAEAKQLATVLVKARYSDLGGSAQPNILVASEEEGVYIVDLESAAFNCARQPAYDKIHNEVVKHLKPEDHATFEAEWNTIKKEQEDWPVERVTMSKDFLFFKVAD